MNAAKAMMRGFSDQIARDLARFAQWREDEERHRTIVVETHDSRDGSVTVKRRPCEACDLWRRQLDNANDEIDRLRNQMRRHGITPERLLDGNQAGYQSLWGGTE